MTAASGAGSAAPVSIDALIGERVHTLMWRARISQQQMGVALGASQGSVSKKLRGRVGWSAGELQAVADVLGVSVGGLFGEVPLDGPRGPEGGECAGRESNPQPAD